MVRCLHEGLVKLLIQDLFQDLAAVHFAPDGGVVGLVGLAIAFEWVRFQEDMISRRKVYSAYRRRLRRFCGCGGRDGRRSCSDSLYASLNEKN